LATAATLGGVHEVSDGGDVLFERLQRLGDFVQPELAAGTARCPPISFRTERGIPLNSAVRNIEKTGAKAARQRSWSRQ